MTTKDGSMKRMSGYAAALVVACGAAWIGAREAGAADTAASRQMKIAYVDTERVLESSVEFKEVDREARGKVEVKEEEGQKKLEDLKKLEEEIEQLAQDKREPQTRELLRRRRELLEFQQQSRDEILEKQGVDLKRIATKIRSVIEVLSREMKLTLVLDVKPVLYLDRTEVIDLTDNVVERLNKEYEQEKDKLRRKLPTKVQ